MMVSASELEHIRVRNKRFIMFFSVVLFLLGLYGHFFDCVFSGSVSATLLLSGSLIFLFSGFLM